MPFAIRQCSCRQTIAGDRREMRGSRRRIRVSASPAVSHQTPIVSSVEKMTAIALSGDNRESFRIL